MFTVVVVDSNLSLCGNARMSLTGTGIVLLSLISRIYLMKSCKEKYSNSAWDAYNALCYIPKEIDFANSDQVLCVSFMDMNDPNRTEKIDRGIRSTALTEIIHRRRDINGRIRLNHEFIPIKNKQGAHHVCTVWFPYQLPSDKSQLLPTEKAASKSADSFLKSVGLPTNKKMIYPWELYSRRNFPHHIVIPFYQGEFEAIIDKLLKQYQQLLTSYVYRNPSMLPNTKGVCMFSTVDRNKKLLSGIKQIYGIQIHDKVSKCMEKCGIEDGDVSSEIRDNTYDNCALVDAAFDTHDQVTQAKKFHEYLKKVLEQIDEDYPEIPQDIVYQTAKFVSC